MAAREHPSLTGRTLTVYPTAQKARGVAVARAGAEGIVLGPAITTFPELSDRLASDLGVAADVLSPAIARVVLEDVIRRRWPSVGDRRGLVRDAHGVIEEFEAAHLAAVDVAALAARHAGSEAGGRLAELADVYEGYETALARLGVVDRHGRARLVADALARAAERGERPATLRGVERIVFAEIYDYSVLQFLIATTLVRLVGDAELIAFAHPENVAATRFLDRTWNRFVGAEPIADQVLPSFVRREGRAGALAGVLRGLFAAERPAPLAPDRSVRLVVAPHRYGEVEAVLREVRERVRTGTPGDRIGILARDMSVYRELVVDVGRRFGVPIEVGGPSGAGYAGAARFVVDLWRVAADGLPRLPLGSVLDSDYVGGRPGRVLRFLTRVGYVAERIAPVEECVRAAAERNERGPGHMPPRLQRCLPALRSLGRQRTVRGHVRALRRALGVIGFRVMGDDAGRPEVARRDAAAMAALTECLGELAMLDRVHGLAPRGPREMADLVDAVLGEAAAPTGLEAAGAVRALSVRDARGLDFDVVYVLGLDDGTFPALQRESVLLPDWLRRETNPAAAEVLRERLGARAVGLPLGALLRTTREAQLEDPFLFFLAASMPERELVLLRPAADGSGTPSVPSPFLAEVAACLSGPVPTTVVPAAALVPAPRECAEPRELLACVVRGRWHGDPAATARLGATVRARLAGAAERLDAIERRVRVERGRLAYFLTPGDPGGPRSLSAGPFVGRIAGQVGLAEAMAGKVWSAASIERLAACGFKFFASDVLGLRGLDDPSPDADARERGSLLHAALALVLERSDLPEDAVRCAEWVRGVLASERTRLMATVFPKDAAVAAAGWGHVVEAVVEVVAEERARRAAWGDVARTTRTEWAFDRPLPAPQGGAGRRVRGRADLVDVVDRPDGTRLIAVTDFKSARERAPLRAMLDAGRELGITAFQVPLYLAVAVAEFGSDGAAVELEGRLVAGLAPVGHKVADARLDTAVVNGVVARVEALAAGAEAGRFDVDPRVCDEWCEFRSVCRYLRPPTEETGDG